MVKNMKDSSGKDAKEELFTVSSVPWLAVKGDELGVEVVVESILGTATYLEDLAPSLVAGISDLCRACACVW